MISAFIIIWVYSFIPLMGRIEYLANFWDEAKEEFYKPKRKK